MVLKVSKNGVRSGNTLRRLHCPETTRYSNQACIVARSNLHSKEIQNLLECSTTDEFISSSLGSTDVILSLNKKKRWTLPATFSHMINTGSFNDEKTIVSLLEHHKLQRRANCVRFICNQGRLQHVSPKQKRYFSLNLDMNAVDQSNRKTKHQEAKAKKEFKVSRIKTTSQKEIRDMKLEESSVMSSSDECDNLREQLKSSKSEYCLEVFYPCPRSCSLVYNSKYTKFKNENKEDGKIYVKSKSKSSRARRKQLAIKNMKHLEEDMFGSNSSEFWDDYNNTDNNIMPKEDQGTIDVETTFEEDTIGKDVVLDSVQNSENLFASYITHAEGTRLHHTYCKKHQRRNYTRSSYKSQRRCLEIKDKSHIVYIDDNKFHFNSTTNESNSICEINKRDMNWTVQSSLVILKSSETTPEHLKAKFGHCYAEANSEPRRFVINITEDVHNLLCTYRNVEQNAMYTSYLVFIFDGVYDEDVDTYKVIFNSNICRETLTISKNIPFEETTFEEIMNLVASTLLDMKQEDMLDLSYNSLEKNCETKIEFY